MAASRRTLSEDILRELLSSYVKAGYEPSREAFEFFVKTNSDELTEKGIRNIYEEILSTFEKDGTTPNDPTMPFLIG